MAERSVGNISVTVDANTNRLTATLTKDAKKIGKTANAIISKELRNIDAAIDFDSQQAKAQARKLRKEIEASLAGLDVEVATRLDLTRAREDLRVIEQEAERLALVLNLGADLSEQDLIDIRADYQGWKTRIENEKIQAKFEAEMTSLNESIQRFRIRQEKEKIKLTAELELQWAEAKLEFEKMHRQMEQDAIDLNLDSAQATAELNAWIKKNGAKSVDVDLNPDVAKATAAFDAWLEHQESKGIDVNVDPDTVRATLAFKQWVKRMEQDEIDVPVNIKEPKGGGGSRGLSMRMKAIAGAIVALMEPAAVALQGLAGAMTSVISSGFSALAGGAGAAAGVFAALGASVGTLVVGFEGMSTALGAVNSEFALATTEGRAFNMNAEDIQKAMARLAPSAQKVVGAFSELVPQFHEIRMITQQNLFRGLDDSLRSLGESTLPQVSTGLAGIATSLNGFLRDLASSMSKVDFAGIFAGLQPVVDNLLRAFSSLVRVVEPFLKAAAPAAKLLSGYLADAAEGLADMVEAGAKSGALGTFLVKGVESLKEWSKLLASVGKLLNTIFKAGATSGDAFVVSLTKIVTKWNEWLQTDAGQASMLAFFDTGKQVMSAMVPLLQGLKDGFENMITGGAINRFADLAENLGDLLRVLGSLFNVLGETSLLNTFIDLLANIAVALEPVMPAIQELANALGGSLASGVSAVSTLLGPLAIAIGALAEFLTPLAPLIVAVGAAWLTWKAVNAVMDGVKASIAGVQLAMKGLGTAMTTGNIAMAGIAAAAGIALLAYQHFTAESKEVKARTAELATALDTQVNALLETATQSTAASLGVTALAKALAEAGTDGEKLTDSLGTLGKTTDDSLDVLQSFGKEGENTTEALTALAKSAGLSGAGVAELVAKVENADDPFFGVSEANRVLAESLGISREEMERVGSAMEEVEDQFKKTDINGTTQDWLASSAASSKLNQELLTQAESLAGVGRNADDVSELYLVYTRLLGENSAEANASAEASAALEAAQAGVGGALDETATAAQKAAEQMSKLEVAIGDVDIFAMLKPSAQAAVNFNALAESATAAADAASVMSDTFDLLIGRHLSAQEATASFEQAIDDMAKALVETEGATGVFAEGFHLTTQAARDSADEINAGITAIGAYAEGALTAGTASEEVAAQMNWMTEQLVDASAGFFGSEEAARAYITQLNLTPENIQTIVNTPGLAEALTQVAAYDSDLDGLPDSADVNYTAPGLDLIKEKLEEYGVDLTGIDDTTIESFFSAPGLADTTDQVDTFATKVDEVQDDAATNVSAPGAVTSAGEVEDVNTAVGDMEARASTTISVPGAQASLDKIKELDRAIDALPPSDQVRIDVTGVQHGIDKVNELKTAIDRLNSKTITVTTNNVSTGGSMAGSLVTGPRRLDVGERGYAEAIVPLQLPLNRVNPAVRDMAELLRGGGNQPTASPSSSSGPRTVINQHFTLPSADPGAVAEQAMNRAAVMVNR